MQVYRKRYDEIMVGIGKAGAEKLAQVTQVITQLFLLFPIPERSPFAEVVAAYAYVLASSFPVWAIDAAGKKLIKSGATFRPSCPELMKLIEIELGPFYDEAQSLRDVLEAKVYHENSPDERARVKTGFKALMADLMMTNVVQHGFIKTREQAERDVDAGFPQMREPLTLSDGARKAFADEDIEF